MTTATFGLIFAAKLHESPGRCRRLDRYDHHHGDGRD